MSNVNPTRLLKVGASITAISGCLAIAGEAFAGGLPAGGHYVAGRGAIDAAGASLTIKQSSTTGIIDWSSFSIGSKSSVRFDNGTGATLNRVTGPDLSTIAGSLHATGSLYLINSQGVIISSTGRIVTGGSFVADDDSSDSLAPDSRHRNGAVINRGIIASGNTVKLIGNAVDNEGAIAAASMDLRATDGAAFDSGTLRATGVRNANILLTSARGKTEVTGTLIARATDCSCGTIETSGRTVSLAGTIDAGRGGSWRVDPVNLTVTTTAASTIDNTLKAGTNVTLETTKTGASGPGTQSSGLGDIIIDSKLSWSTGATLTLDAYHSVMVDAPVVVTGKGGVTIDYAEAGNLSFGAGSITFDSLSSHLTINKRSYTLVSTIAQLATDANNNQVGVFALANSINASALGHFAHSPIPTEFDGIFEGLGNTVSNLVINDTAGDEYVGFFADSISNSAVLRDLNLVNVDVVAHESLTGSDIGGFVGYSGGTISGVNVSGKIIVEVTNEAGSDVGGVTGINWGTVENSTSTAAVTSPYAHVGGLVGDNEDLISDSYATGTVSGGNAGSDAGGLTGFNNPGVSNSVSIKNSYATGAVSGSDGTNGGLVGVTLGGEIEFVYSTGGVKGSGSEIGGLVGEDDAEGSFADAFFDTTTSGIGASGGAGNITDDHGIYGRTTAQLQAGFPAGFSDTIWGRNSKINDGLPYLIALASTY